MHSIPRAANSESVAMQCAKHTLVEQGLLSGGSFESLRCTSRDSEPGVADYKAEINTAYYRNSSLCNELQREGSVTNYVRNKKG